MGKTRWTVAAFLLGLFLLPIGCSSSGGDEAAQENMVTAAAEPAETPTPVPTEEPTPTPLPVIDLAPELPEGDPERGRSRALVNGCFSCHVASGHVAPSFLAGDGLPAILERGEVRIADPNYGGRATNNLEYVIESVFQPKAYFAPGDWEGAIMPSTFMDSLSEQDLADILAWMGNPESE